MLRDGRIEFSCSLREKMLIHYPPNMIPAESEVSLMPPAPARVNHGRWIVDCPLCVVSSEYVWLETLVMLCGTCFNARTGWRQVILPDNREEIEALLIVRPLPNRNWDFGDTLDKLRADNLAHGYPI